VTCLQDPNMKGIPFHMLRADVAGNISKRFSLSGIEIPVTEGLVQDGIFIQLLLHQEKFTPRYRKCLMEKNMFVLQDQWKKELQSMECLRACCQ